MNATAEHLGGYKVGGDPLSWYPELWSFVVATLGVRSAIDVGCGTGAAVDWFNAYGCFAIGVEGVPQDNQMIRQHDYTLGPWTTPARYDLAWSIEFVEHVEEQFIPNFLATFACADLVMMSHAVPGQKGTHHVNCQDDDYWIAQLATIGYSIDADLTEQTRVLAGHGYYQRTGLAFRA